MILHTREMAWTKPSRRGIFVALLVVVTFIYWARWFLTPTNSLFQVRKAQQELKKTPVISVLHPLTPELPPPNPLVQFSVKTIQVSNEYEQLFPQYGKNEPGQHYRIENPQLLNRPGSRDNDSVLIVCVFNDAKSWGRNRNMEDFFRLIGFFKYPQEKISITLLTSSMQEFIKAKQLFGVYIEQYPRLSIIFRNDFISNGLTRANRHNHSLQASRRRMLARYRNYALLSTMESWHQHVVWLDADVTVVPSRLLEKMVLSDRDILEPMCVRLMKDKWYKYDKNAWVGQRKVRTAEQSAEAFVPGPLNARSFHNLPDKIKEFVPLDSVGGTMLYVRAEIHRQGVVFPANYIIGSEWGREGYDGIETEGLCYSAHFLGFKRHSAFLSENALSVENSALCTRTAAVLQRYWRVTIPILICNPRRFDTEGRLQFSSAVSFPTFLIPTTMGKKALELDSPTERDSIMSRKKNPSPRAHNRPRKSLMRKHRRQSLEKETAGQPHSPQAESPLLKPEEDLIQQQEIHPPTKKNEKPARRQKLPSNSLRSKPADTGNNQNEQKAQPPARRSGLLSWRSRDSTTSIVEDAPPSSCQLSSSCFIGSLNGTMSEIHLPLLTKQTQARVTALIAAPIQRHLEVTIERSDELPYGAYSQPLVRVHFVDRCTGRALCPAQMTTEAKFYCGSGNNANCVSKFCLNIGVLQLILMFLCGLDAFEWHQPLRFPVDMPTFLHTRTVMLFEIVEVKPPSKGSRFRRGKRFESVSTHDEDDEYHRISKPTPEYRRIAWGYFHTITNKGTPTMNSFVLPDIPDEDEKKQAIVDVCGLRVRLFEYQVLTWMDNYQARIQWGWRKNHPTVPAVFLQYQKRSRVSAPSTLHVQLKAIKPPASPGHIVPETKVINSENVAGNSNQEVNEAIDGNNQEPPTEVPTSVPETVQSELFDLIAPCKRNALEPCLIPQRVLCSLPTGKKGCSAYRLLSASSDGTVQLWELPPKSSSPLESPQPSTSRSHLLPLIFQWHHFPCFVYCGIFLPTSNGGIILSGASDGCVRFRKESSVVNGLPEYGMLQVSSVAVHTICVEAKSGRVFCGDAKGEITVWKRTSGSALSDYERIKTIQTGQTSITSLQLHPRKAHLLVHTQPNGIFQYELRSYLLLNKSYAGVVCESLLVKSTFSPDGKLVISGSEDGVPRLFTSLRGQQLQHGVWGTRFFHDYPVLDVSWSPTAHMAALCSYGGNNPIVVLCSYRDDKDAAYIDDSGADISVKAVPNLQFAVDAFTGTNQQEAFIGDHALRLQKALERRHKRLQAMAALEVEASKDQATKYPSSPVQMPSESNLHESSHRYKYPEAARHLSRSQLEILTLASLFRGTGGRLADGGSRSTAWTTQTGWDKVLEVAAVLTNGGNPIPKSATMQSFFSTVLGVKWERNHVVALDLSENGLTGEFPAEVIRLRFLTSLKMRNNQYLRGTLPREIYSMPHLKYCYVDGTMIEKALPFNIAHSFQISQLKLESRRSTRTTKSTVTFCTGDERSGNTIHWMADMTETEMEMVLLTLKRLHEDTNGHKGRRQIKCTASNATGPERAAAAVKLQRIYRARIERTKFRTFLRSLVEMKVDPTTGSKYYVNARTGEATWEKPKFLGPDTESNGDIDNDNDNDNASNNALDERDAWKPYDDGYGNTYYWNSVTGDSTWEPPSFLSRIYEELRERYGSDKTDEERFDLFFNDIDRDGTGEIDQDEFARLCGDLGMALSAKQIQEVFRELDTSGDGQLDRPEIIAWLTRNFK
ncbi:Jouberin [Phytophthora citrophthora]|uniref:Jouberin n=1 Tax=Phytophthora citrophthora TaxID=4793 RepID=A0AAD9G5W4_9STRA|nr:Jouberin [Phytophthora citrophthora]